MPPTIPGLDAIARLSADDPGLRDGTTAADRRAGAEAARSMNDVIATAIAATGANADGRIDEWDVRRVSTYIRRDDALLATFVEGHGDDDGAVETGYHRVQGDGGTTTFQGRDFIDTVADAIYHVGFRFADGRLRNEDGAANERIEDVAGWLNYFVNGVNVVYGTNADEFLGSGRYDAPVAEAANELFRAGGGDDVVVSGAGDDTVRAGTGDDTVVGGGGADDLKGGAGDDLLMGKDGDDVIGGGAGDDTINGGAGDDAMKGGRGDDLFISQAGDDTVDGGAGSDTIWGKAGDDSLSGGRDGDLISAHEGRDVIDGGSGDDTIMGGADDDTVDGGAGDDRVWGGPGDDLLRGGAGSDTLQGSGGADRIEGGAGRDVLLAWEPGADARDTFVFAPGDTYAWTGGRDEIKGFSDADVIDLRAYGGLAFADGDGFAGGGQGSVRVERDAVLIDADGDGRTDAAITLAWAQRLDADAFVF